MLSLKRGLAMTGAMGLLAGLAFAIPAQAATSTVCAIEGDAAANVQWVGGSGTYSFNQFEAACVAADAAAPAGSPAAVTAQLSITSNGSFTNAECGTGFASDPALAADPNGNAYPADPNGAGPAVTVVPGSVTPADPNNYYSGKLAGADLGYELTFTSGQGTLRFTNKQAGKTAVNPLVPGTPGGVISIQPDPTKGQNIGLPPSGFCTNGFRVEGTVNGQT